MAPQQIKKLLIPVLALAALVVIGAVVALVVLRPDTSEAGLSETMPPADAPQWAGPKDGIRIWDVKEGLGEACPRGDTVTTHYIGWLAANGQKFDSSRDQGKPMEFNLDFVIKGWTEGIPGMKVGGIRRIYIPWPLAYSEEGKPPKIPGKSDLIFEIKLVSFKNPKSK